MQTRIFENEVYRGEPAVLIENGTVRALLCPARGAKIASLCLRRGDGAEPAGWTEVLSQIDGDRYRIPPEYGREFQGEDGSGFDDMAATIDACEIRVGQGAQAAPGGTGGKGSPGRSGSSGSSTDTSSTGNSTDTSSTGGTIRGTVRLPDHGEAWSRPWSYRLDGDSVILSIDGKALPYHFMKKIFLSDDTLVVDYSAENRASVRIPFQWAAHALFHISPGARLDVPADMKKIHNVCPSSTLPEAGVVYDYPRPFGPQGIDLSRMPPKNGHGAQKYWFTDAATEGRCSITDPEIGIRSSLLFDPADLPWLGIWVNEGFWHNGYNLGIEPSTCWLDSPAASIEHGRCLFLEAGEIKEWTLRVKLEAV